VTERDCFDFKRWDATRPTDGFELAKDVAAMANTLGGAVLFGAKGSGDFLASYEPVTQDAANEIKRLVEQAVRDRCSPVPNFSVDPIQVAEAPPAFVVAVNVSPYPGQLVGVEVKRGEAKCGADMKQPEILHWFPYRIGTHTKGLRPEQLPMYLDPRVRRIVQVLSPAIGSRMQVITRGVAPPGVCTYLVTVTSVDIAENALSFTMVSGSATHSPEAISVPLDGVLHAWRVPGRCWFATLSGELQKINMADDRGVYNVDRWSFVPG